MIEHVGDVFALVSDLERLAVVAASAADLALDIDVGEEVHLDLFHWPSPVARLAASAFHVERKAPGSRSRACARQGARANSSRIFAECAGVGRGIRARRASDGRLIDHDGLVDLIEAV